jgi:hypothetical protein
LKGWHFPWNSLETRLETCLGGKEKKPAVKFAKSTLLRQAQRFIIHLSKQQRINLP